MSNLVADLSAQKTLNLNRYTIIMVVVESLCLFGTFCSRKILLHVKASTTRSLHYDLASTLAKASSETVEKNSSVALSERLREGTNFVSYLTEIYREFL